MKKTVLIWLLLFCLPYNNQIGCLSAQNNLKAFDLRGKVKEVKLRCSSVYMDVPGKIEEPLNGNVDLYFDEKGYLVKEVIYEYDTIVKTVRYQYDDELLLIKEERIHKDYYDEVITYDYAGRFLTKIIRTYSNETADSIVFKNNDRGEKIQMIFYENGTIFFRNFYQYDYFENGKIAEEKTLDEYDEEQAIIRYNEHGRKIEEIQYPTLLNFYNEKRINYSYYPENDLEKQVTIKLDRDLYLNTTYRYNAFDESGNWIIRTQYSYDSAIFSCEREIQYY